jgi:hypothetical protein
MSQLLAHQSSSLPNWGTWASGRQDVRSTGNDHGFDCHYSRGSRGNPPDGRILDGINLLPILDGKEPPRERTLFWRSMRSEQDGGRKQKAVRKGNWKYVWDMGTELVFNLEQDISERHDLRYQHPDLVDEMRELLKQWEQEMDLSNPRFSIK